MSKTLMELAEAYGKAEFDWGQECAADFQNDYVKDDLCTARDALFAAIRRVEARLRSIVAVGDNGMPGASALDERDTVIHLARATLGELTGMTSDMERLTLISCVSAAVGIVRELEFELQKEGANPSPWLLRCMAEFGGAFKALPNDLQGLVKGADEGEG